MITISITETSIHVLGHAGAGPPGQDIVCSAVSTLAQNLISSIEELTDSKQLSGVCQNTVTSHEQAVDPQLREGWTKLRGRSGRSKEGETHETIHAI